MIIQYNDFKTWLNQKLFEKSYSDLISKIADNPDRFIGIFRPTKPKTKLIQNITQSHEIRFGDALEFIFEKYFKEEGFTLITKRFKFNDKELNVDQLFEKDNVIYMIEQKVRDDHDSTKKRGQFQNFENKYFALTSMYQQKTIIPIMWFIDDSLTKNKKYYLEEMERMQMDYQCKSYLFYGKEMFNNSTEASFRIEMWNEILDYLEQWKQSLPDMPEVNFDLQAEKVFEEIKGVSPVVYRKLFENKEIIEKIFPILFPENKVLKKLEDYFYSEYKTNNQTIYKTLSDKLQVIVKKDTEYISYPMDHNINYPNKMVASPNGFRKYRNKD